MSPWLLNMRMDDVVLEVNVGVFGKGLELLSANGGRSDVNHLLFVDDTARVADLEKKLCRLVSEFGRICERRKLRVNVDKSKVMKCSRYLNGRRMHMILIVERSEEVDCFKYLTSWCERNVVHKMNEGYRAWGALKRVLSNRGLGIKAKKFLYDGVIVPPALFGAEA